MEDRKTFTAMVTGFLIGAVVVFWSLFIGTVQDEERWRCTQYSPETGECVVRQRKDFYPDPEE